MNLLLVVRSEILGMVIILFLIMYDRFCAKYREGKDYFIGFALTALGHVAMGLVTEISVNSDSIPVIFNDIFHVLFFAFALLFSLRYYEYILSLITIKDKKFKLMIPAYILSLASILVMFLSKIDYLQGNGTKYSAGMGPTLCYMLGFILFIFSDVLLIINRKKVSRHVLNTILPLSVLGLGMMAIQIVVPEFLFTGASLVIVALGAFFAIENPVGKFRDRAFIDLNTGIWNRNCYVFDLAQPRMEERLADGHTFIYLLGDLNGLKKVNDEKGHLEGDIIIETAARILSEKLTSAWKVYRIGGDEYVALFFDVAEDVVQKEITAVHEACEEYNKNAKTPVTISMGYAVHQTNETLDKLANRADDEMYRAKDAFYQKMGWTRRE